jgi:hypothetical protein
VQLRGKHFDLDILMGGDLPHLPSDSVMFSAYQEYGKIPMALSCRFSGFYGPYTMDRNNYIEKNLILDTKTLDDKNAVHGEKSDFLGQLTEKIRGCGVSFYIWTKKGTTEHGIQDNAYKE